jgi:hypothetical protein
MFPREMEQAEALSAASSAHAWLEDRFVKGSERRFEALSLTLYKEDHR